MILYHIVNTMFVTFFRIKFIYIYYRYINKKNCFHFPHIYINISIWIGQKRFCSVPAPTPKMAWKTERHSNILSYSSWVPLVRKLSCVLFRYNQTEEIQIPKYNILITVFKLFLTITSFDMI